MAEKTGGICEKVIIAGFGGQGILFAGKLLARAAMEADLEVTYMPSYGAEVRGGTAKCAVIISSDPIACPIVSESDSLIVMNGASLDKYAAKLKSKGLLIANSSIVNCSEPHPQLDSSVETIAVAADEIAVELGNPKAANMVVLGAYLGQKKLLSLDLVIRILPNVLASRYHNTLADNTEALRRGAKFAATYQKCT